MCLEPGESLEDEVGEEGKDRGMPEGFPQPSKYSVLYPYGYGKPPEVTQSL